MMAHSSKQETWGRLAEVLSLRWLRHLMIMPTLLTLDPGSRLAKKWH